MFSQLKLLHKICYAHHFPHNTTRRTCRNNSCRCHLPSCRIPPIVVEDDDNDNDNDVDVARKQLQLQPSPPSICPMSVNLVEHSRTATVAFR